MYINLTIKALNRNQYTGLLNRRLILCTFIFLFLCPSNRDSSLSICFVKKQNQKI